MLATPYRPLHVITRWLSSGQYPAYGNDMARIADKVFQMRASEAWLTKLDEWRRHQPDIPGRAEAIRRLVERGLEAEGADPPPAKRQAVRSGQ